MVVCSNERLVNIREEISSEILNWAKGKEKILNVCTLPYNSSDIFLKVVLFYLDNRKKVLYITEEDESNIEIINLIKKCSAFREYSYIRKENISCDKNLIICNHEIALGIKEKFDLVIYNDISTFSKYKNCEVMENIIKNSTENNKCICYSLQSIFVNAREITIPVRNNNMPLPEPRFITTRINLNEEIPFVMYEYLNFSMECNRKVIIYVPDEETVINLYNYLDNLKKNLSKNISFFIKGKTDRKVYESFSKIKRAIIITNEFKDFSCDLKDIDVIVYLAENTIYDCKKLMYICGKVGSKENTNRGEVIFLSGEVTIEMEKAKNIARSYNKEAWERNLLKF